LFSSALSVRAYKKIHNKKVDRLQAKLKAQKTEAERCDIEMFVLKLKLAE
jgi:hypothetical protein